MKMRIGATTGWGPRAARVFSAAAGAVLVVVLAGCSLGGSMADAPPSVSNNQPSAEPQALSDQTESDKAAPPAFHFQSGDLVLGDFNYDEIAGNIFNPCEEISAEEFAAIGFETDGKVRRLETKDLNGCVLRPVTSDSWSYAMSGGTGNLAATRQQRRVVKSDVSKNLPGVYTFSDVSGEFNACGAAVDTIRGQLGLIVGQLNDSQLSGSNCERAVEVLEQLYQLEH